MKRGPGVGWWILGGAAVLALILAVNGSLAAKFSALWHWISTIGSNSTPAKESTVGKLNEAVQTSPPVWQHIGPVPVLNPVNLARDAGQWIAIVRGGAKG
jgi:hypothetical protein